jgi:hypothetical protein
MALHPVTPPPKVLDTYQESLGDYGMPAQKEVSLYHLPVGALGLEELANGGGLEHVAPSGCRFVASWSNGVCTSCEMTNPSLYGLARFRNFVTGGSAAGVLRRIEEAERLPAVQKRNYALHFLSVPDILFEGLHLVCEGQGSDFILPTASSYPELPETAVLNASDFLAAASHLARARRAHGTAELSS